MSKLDYLMGRGMISRDVALRRKRRKQAAFAMAGPEEHYKDEGRVDQEDGAVNVRNMLMDPAHVSAGSRERASGKPSSGPKGGTVYGKEWEPGPNHLNNPALQKKHYPGHKVTGRPGTPSAKKNYPMQKRPPYYGGGGPDTY